jgi:hypothetical protein
MKAYGERSYNSTVMTSALDGGEWLASRLIHVTPGEVAHGTHSIGGWVGPGAGLNVLEKRKILPLPDSKPGRRDHSPSLYRMS